MAKQGLNSNNIEHVIRDKGATSGWALCVGAGTSLPAFPNWTTLVQRLVAHDVGADKAPKLTEQLLKQFSPDALIQAAFDRFKCTPKEFSELLARELYSNIKNQLNEEEWKQFVKVLSSAPGMINRTQRGHFLSIVRTHFPSVSALALAELLSLVIESDSAPSSILSFNAEPLLFALTNTLIADKFTDNSSPTPRAKEQRHYLDLVTHSISNRKARRIPYIFCHGLLPVPDAPRTRQQRESIDKLVFSETSYLQLANSSFSWQSSVFLNTCSVRSVVFIGASLSDPNMRRWLSWIHANRTQELRERRDYTGASTSHYWISKTPTSEMEQDWIESSVAHLGVRLIWLKDWADLKPTLHTMLAI